jgi:hypothetical protein
MRKVRERKRVVESCEEVEIMKEEYDKEDRVGMIDDRFWRRGGSKIEGLKEWRVGGVEDCKVKM